MQPEGFTLCIFIKALLSYCYHNITHNIMHIQLIFADYCESDEFTCNNRKCVPDYDRCDGFNDCGDYSDEDGCK